MISLNSIISVPQRGIGHGRVFKITPKSYIVYAGAQKYTVRKDEEIVIIDNSQAMPVLDRSQPHGKATHQCQICGEYYAPNRESFIGHVKMHERERVDGGGAPFTAEDRESLMPKRSPAAITLHKTWQTRHSPECAAAMQESIDAHNAWLDRWPKACQRCGAQGLTGYWQVGDNDAMRRCEACLRVGRCPRCGTSGSISTSPPTARAKGCSACGWRFDDQLPGVNRCTCGGGRAWHLRRDRGNY